MKAVKIIRSIIFCYILFVSVFIVDDAIADTLHLHNGDVISGNIVTYQDGFCVFSTKYGGAITVITSDIKKIVTDNAYVISLNTGENIQGIFVSGDTNINTVASDSFGNIPVSNDKIMSLIKIHPPKESQSSAKAAKSSVEVAETEFGSEDTEKTPPLDFLSGTTVLLQPGKVELDLDFSYKQSRTVYPLTQAGYFQKSSYSARQLEAAASLRAGLWEGSEAWVRVPVIYGKVHDVSSNDWVRSKERVEAGDISFGLQQMLLRENESHPAVSVSLGVSAPTGQKRYRELASTWKDTLDNGSGHWSVTPGISFVRTIDPAILFGGVSYQYFFEEKIDGYRVKPGWSAVGYLGLGFALNEKLSLGTRLSHGYSSEFKADGTTIQGSDFEATDLSFTASYRAWEKLVVSPYVTFGLNRDAGASTFGIRFTRSF